MKKIILALVISSSSAWAAKITCTTEETAPVLGGPLYTASFVDQESSVDGARHVFLTVVAPVVENDHSATQTILEDNSNIVVLNIRNNQTWYNVVSGVNAKLAIEMNNPSKGLLAIVPTQKTYSVTCTGSSQSATLWSLTQQTVIDPAQPGMTCPQQVIAIETPQGVSVKPIGPFASTDLKYGWYIDTSKGQGPQCQKLNSSYILGGYYCSETRQNGHSYSFAACDNQMGPFKCSPFDKKNLITTIDINNNTLTVVDDNNVINSGATHTQCVYQKSAK